MEAKELAETFRGLGQDIRDVANEEAERHVHSDARRMFYRLADKLDPPGCEHDWEEGMIFRNTPKCVWVRRCRKCHMVKAPVLAKNGFVLKNENEWESIFDGHSKSQSNIE